MGPPNTSWRRFCSLWYVLGHQLVRDEARRRARWWRRFARTWRLVGYSMWVRTGRPPGLPGIV